MGKTRAMPRRGGSASVVMLATLASLAVGVAAGAALTIPATPAPLADAASTILVPVTPRNDDDARTVILKVSDGEQQTLSSPVGGRVSASTCSPGAKVTSGESILTVNGRGLINLATKVPLWRDLSAGVRGSDAAGINAELRRLGYHAPQGNQVTAQTVSAYRRLAGATHTGQPQSSKISLSGILWQPRTSITVASCPVRLGGTVGPGSPILKLQATPLIRLTALPADAVGGARVIVLDQGTYPIGTGGTVTDSTAIQQILGSSALASADTDAGGSRQVTVTWKLARPAPVLVTSPGALLTAGADQGCVFGADHAPHAVRVVGSELGQTFLAPQAGQTIPDQVLSTPPAGATCG